MKTLIKQFAAVALGMSLVSTSLSAGAYNLSCATSAWQGIYADGTGGDPYVPSGAGVGWYAYSYGPNAYAHVEVYGNGISVNVYAPADGSDSGSGSTSAAGTLTIRIHAQVDPNFGGSAGAGVTVNW